MSEESKQDEEETPQDSAELDLTEGARSGTAKSVWAALLLSVIALAVAAAGLYFQYQSHDTVASRFQAVDNVQSQLQDVERRLGELASGREALVDRIEDLSGGQEEHGERIDNLYRRQKSDNIDWAVAEIEHLMIIAEHSLTLRRDRTTALAALEAADDRLRDLGEPGLTAVRRQLTSDINALRSVDEVDIDGLSLYLADVAGRVEELPLPESLVREEAAPEEKQPTGQSGGGEEAPAWRRLLSGVWEEIKGLVVITRTDASGRALLMPEERYFLYQNLRLQLESARMAVFRRDTENFQASLDLAVTWLEEYFRTDSSAVANVIQSLKEMRRVELERELPAISSSLESLRAWIKERAQSSTGPSAEGDPAS